ncbi:hypothetical protein BWQ96_03862 [Gracilariopsis chorda]|uniref:Uncharacterized protein n=1 Tax=Gracilariopsis chorda TaxID=448386 RepID=A0A2V3IWB2_9FLOR|nr:hypothetical protein BWQ96_03862 [Gracilariopsis chorda]|eukprot:PXF46363.1 hypothetical protein BWQ96_03862 [Gracilariopsis chorda]
MSSLNIATQAESSFRSLTQWEHHAFRQLRETGSLHTIPDHPDEHPSSPSVSSTSSFSSAIDLPNYNPQQLQNIVLIGHTRTIMLHLAHRLTSTFAPPASTDGDLHRTKSILYINGQLIRLVLIECPPNTAAPDIAARVQRQSPKLVLLCADFYNMSSFELVVRLDMDILDYLNISCIWVLMKTTTKRRCSYNCVDDTDVSAANHFLSSPRRCFVVTVDGIQRSVNLKKLGMCIHRSASGPPRASQAHTFTGQFRLSVAKSLSSFCLAVHRSNQKTSTTPNRQTRLPRWLWS